MRKIKIFITIFALYEFVVLTVLQIPPYCNAIFNYNFCFGGGLKYFLLCIMFPGLIGLVIWWMPDIVTFGCPRKCNPQTDFTLKNIFDEIISKQDIEKFITAAIIMGIQKFVQNHPDTTEKFDSILNALKHTHTEAAH